VYLEALVFDEQEIIKYFKLVGDRSRQEMSHQCPLHDG